MLPVSLTKMRPMTAKELPDMIVVLIWAAPAETWLAAAGRALMAAV